RAILDNLPQRRAIQKRVDALIRSNSVSFSGLVDRHGKLFALEEDPKKQQPFVVALPDLDHPAAARAVVDPNVLDPAGHTAIDFWVPSLDGAKLAVSLSKGGSEAGDLHVYDVATGKEIDAVISHVNNGTAGGSVAWNGDGTGFWYTRYPRPGERPPEDAGFFQQVWFHRLGTPVAQDVYELGKELPRIAEIALATSEDGRYVLAEVKNGDGGDFAYFLRPAAGAWIQLAKFEDGVKAGALGLDGAVYLLSRQGAPKGKVLRLPLDTPALAAAKEVVPEGEGSIEAFVPTAQKLYVVDLLGGPSRMRAFPLTGGPAVDVPTPPVSAIEEVDRLEGGSLALEVGTYLEPPAFYRLDAATGALTKTALAITSLADYSDCEVVRVFATSKDGTKVPLNIIQKKGIKLNGRNPTLVYGYGGYGISEQPMFSASRRVWLDSGGVYVDVNLRGGGEYGEAWHKAGNLTHKQNVFDDFYAATQWLIGHEYCDVRHLGILGGSNGGLLMGAELTQHPQAFHAVVSAVGIYDMLRVEDTPNGQFNVTEFGTVKDPEQFKALYAYSPYHHVVDGTAYPAILMLTGKNDPRVDPWHSRKMIARLQAADASPRPVLLRTTQNAGHGIGSSLDEIIAQRVDIYAFLVAELGARYHAPAAPRKRRAAR
ncbi:MAG TPA: prolyl oligopeptidase family serine peptidase, partial [Myxococcales bacterium]|nr:prolyl oligopeptidase family serine peptidase [Myxococcales bacterium]